MSMTTRFGGARSTLGAGSTGVVLWVREPVSIWEAQPSPHRPRHQSRLRAPESPNGSLLRCSAAVRKMRARHPPRHFSSGASGQAHVLCEVNPTRGRRFREGSHRITYLRVGTRDALHWETGHGARGSRT